MFSEKLRKLRNDKGYTQSAMASELGVSQQTIAKWESSNATPHLDTLTRIAAHFSLPASYFIESESEEDDYERVLERKQIVAILELLTTFEVRRGIKGVYEREPSYAHTLEVMLTENDELMSIAHSALSLVLDALVIGALEVSGIKMNQAIARLSFGEQYDMEKAIAEARSRFSKRVNTSSDILTKLMDKMSEAFFEDNSYLGVSKQSSGDDVKE
jgi:transcriptional regulator with XRE-family HTH domain